MPTQYQCSNCGFPLSSVVGTATCPNCSAMFALPSLPGQVPQSPYPNRGNRADSSNYRPNFGDDYEEQRRRLGLWGPGDYELHRPRINPLEPPLPGSPGFRGIGLGAATFTWTEAIGIFAFGAVAGLIGYKALEKAGRV